jgi:hypothetical protein
LVAATEAVSRHERARLDELLTDLRAAAPDDWQLALPGLAAWAMRGSQGNMAIGQTRLESWFQEQPPRLVPPGESGALIEQTLEGLGRYGSGANITPSAVAGELDQLALLGTSDAKDAIVHGFGWRLQRVYGLNPRGLSALLADRPPALAEAARQAFGDAQAELWVD